MTRNGHSMLLIWVATSLISDLCIAAPALYAVGPIRNEPMGNLCLDTSSSTVAAGNTVVALPCNNADKQDWLFTIDGQIRNKSQVNLCLNMATNTDVTVEVCSRSVGQIWSSGAFSIIFNAFDERCIDMVDAQNNNVFGYECNGTSGQIWSLIPMPWSPIQSYLAPDRCMNILDADAAENSSVVLGVCEKHGEQMFLLNGLGQLVSSTADDRCVTPLNGQLTAQTDIVVSSCTSSAVQRWSFVDGQLRNQASSSMCISVVGGSSSESTNIELANCQATDAQRFRGSTLLPHVDNTGWCGTHCN